jgi:hypothetical protein
MRCEIPTRTTILVMLLMSLHAGTEAAAQIVYEPPRVQHGGQNPYYYAGKNPAVHRAAAAPHVPGTAFGRGRGFAFASGDRTVDREPPRVFTDAIPGLNAADFGMTPDDAENESRARLATHYVKADLLRHAQRQGRSIIIPAHPQDTIVIQRTTPRPGKIIRWVFPRDLLDRELPNPKPNDTRAEKQHNTPRSIQ